MWRRCGRQRVVVHILETQHIGQSALCAAGKATVLCESRRFFERIEHAVPDSEIAEVVPAGAELVVDRMVLGPLEEPAQPLRRVDVGMVKILPAAPKNDVHARASAEPPNT